VGLSERILLAEMARARGEAEIASEQYAQAIQLGGSMRLSREAARYGLRVEHWPNMLPAARRWAALDPDSPEAQWHLGLAELMAGEASRAAKAFDAWLGDEPGRAEWHALRQEWESLPRPWRVWQVAQELVGGRNDAHAQETLARLALGLDRLGDAQRHIRRAERLAPEREGLAWLAFRIRAAQGDARVLQELDLRLGAFIAADPGEDRDQRLMQALELATVLWEQDRLDEARELLDWALAENPIAQPLEYALALVEIQAGDKVSAEARLERLARQGFRIRENWFQLGRLAEDRGDPEQALRWYDRVQSGEEQIEARARAIAMLFKLDREASAWERLETLESRMGEHRHRFRVKAGSILLGLEQSEPGLALCRRALDKRPEDADAYYHCGLGLLLNERDSPQATAWLRRAQAIWPQEPDLLNALGYSLADQNQALRPARRMIRQALNKRPDNGAIMDSLGWVEYRLGNLRPARRWLERAWARSPSPEIAAHLLEVRWQQGDRDEANDLKQRASARWPDEEILRETWERLQGP